MLPRLHHASSPPRHRARGVLFAVALASAACSLGACGIKGPLKPPPTAIPQGSASPELTVPAPNAPHPGQQPPAPVEPPAVVTPPAK